MTYHGTSIGELAKVRTPDVRIEDADTQGGLIKALVYEHMLLHGGFKEGTENSIVALEKAWTACSR